MAATNQQVLDFLLSSPNLSDADIYRFMQEKGVPASQISNVTGVPISEISSRVEAIAPKNVLGGTILAGDSWLAGEEKTAIAKEAFGEDVTNVAVGGFKTQDALDQLNSFLNKGGVFKEGSTVVLDIGGNDLLQGVSRNTVKSNIDQMLSIFEREGVKVVLSGAPAVGSVSDVTSSTNLKMDSLYKEVAEPYKNVTVVDAMSGLLNSKTLVDESGFHVNAKGQTEFINQLASATDKKATPTEVVSELAKAQTAATIAEIPGGENIADKLTRQILGQGTTDKWGGQGKGSAQANAADMANILTSIGISDINQFGQITKQIPVTYTDDNGSVYNTGETQTVTTYGNKLTGQEVPSTYGERQTGNAWGGTFDGKGNTGYRVEFDAQGKPLFYTTGASSSDVPSWVKPALILGAAYFGLDAAGLLGGTGAAGAAGLTAAEAAGLGLTASEAAALGLSASEFAAAGGLGAGFTAAGLPSGVGTFLGENVVSGVPAFDAAFTSAGGLFNPAFGLPAGNGAFLGEGVPTGIPASDAAYLNAGGTFNPAYALGADGLIGTPLTTPPAVVPPTGVPPVVPPTTVPPVVPPTGVPPVASTIAKSLIPATVSGLLSPTNVGNLVSGGLGTAGNLLQMQQSREAAKQAQARIDAETAAAKAAAQFRPIGMTTRFGTSQFQTDPVTGQLISAGYTLSPEAKAQQDRFVALSNQGLTQAEAAQQQFAPLQTGAQRLFGLGNQYLAQTPEAVAQNYLNQQMALLQPGRETELANLQNRLQQQGRGGLSVAQGGTMGATTPELQALYNARAQQEAQLAANAQQLGQRDVLFGAGLLGQGSQAMGQYYGGQQAAYAPYTTAQGQVQNLEALGQQPFNMSTALAGQTSAAGARMGELGLRGAGQSVALATGADATRNLGAQSLIAAGNPNAQFGQAIGGALGGLFNAPQSGFSYGQYGTGIDPSTGEYFGSLYF